jgi:hypothetical protein
MQEDQMASLAVRKQTIRLGHQIRHWSSIPRAPRIGSVELSLAQGGLNDVNLLKPPDSPLFSIAPNPHK